MLPTHLTHFPIRKACRFGKAVPPCTAKGPAARLTQRDSVAWRDKDRQGTLSSAQHGPDSIFSDPERGSSCPAVRYRTMPAHQTTLGAPEGGNVEKETQVACEAEAARMGESVTVTNHETRFQPEMAVSAKERGNLPKAQETRDVREGGAAPGATDLEDLKSGPGEEDESSVEQSGVGVIGYVGPGHAPDGAPEGDQRNAPRKAELQSCRLLRGEVPGMGRNPSHQGCLSPEGAFLYPGGDHGRGLSHR